MGLDHLFFTYTHHDYAHILQPVVCPTTSSYGVALLKLFLGKLTSANLLAMLAYSVSFNTLRIYPSSIDRSK